MSIQNASEELLGSLWVEGGLRRSRSAGTVIQMGTASC